MNPNVFRLATHHHSQLTDWTLFHGQSSVFRLSKKKLATHVSIHPLVMSKFTWVSSFWLDARSCQTKKLPRGHLRLALLPKFHGCRTRSIRIYLTKELRGKGWDHGT